MKTLKKIQQRNSARILIDPKPSDDELNGNLQAAKSARSCMVKTYKIYSSNGKWSRKVILEKVAAIETKR